MFKNSRLQNCETERANKCLQWPKCCNFIRSSPRYWNLPSSMSPARDRNPNSFYQSPNEAWYFSDYNVHTYVFFILVHRCLQCWNYLCDDALRTLCIISAFEERYIDTAVKYVSCFFIIKPTRCTNFTNLFCHETLHISDSSSVHHQEFIHCTLSNGICHTGL